MQTSAATAARWPLRTILERLMEYVTKTDACWLFTGTRSRDGYGHLKVDGRTLKTHRIAYEQMVGPIPDGMHVLHICDVRNCVRPDHLWIGSHADNMEDRNRKGRARGRFSKERVA